MVDLMKLRLGDRFECGGMESKVTSLATMIGDTMLVNCWQYSRDGVSVTGSRRPITAIHPAAEPADGWVSFSGACVRDYGESTVCIEDTEIGFQVRTLGGEQPFEWDIGMCKTVEECCAAVDAAYALHCEPKPVLVWDESLPTLPRASFRDGVYVITFIGNLLCDAWFHFPGGADCTCQKVSIEEAKAACERHARGG